MTFARRRHVPLLLLAAVILLLLPLSAGAQSDGALGSDFDDAGNGGRSTIQGRLYLPSGRRPERRFRVRLSSVRGETSTMTDDSGAFVFRRLAAGTYRLTVDGGREYDQATETVDLFDSGRTGTGQTVTVQINLQARAPVPVHPAGVVDAALAGIPAAARELYERALRAAQGGERKEAVEHLKRAVELHPQFSLARNEMGVQYMALGQPERAAEVLREAIKLTPEVAMLHLNYGLVLVQQKKHAEAERALRDALARDPALAVARLYLGRVLIKLARLDEAEKELRAALQTGGEAPMSAAYRYLGALYIERGERERAAEALETYLRLAPQAPDAAQVRDIIAQQRAPEQK